VNMEITSLAKDCESRFSHGHPAIPETASSRRSERGRQLRRISKKASRGNPLQFAASSRVPSLFSHNRPPVDASCVLSVKHHLIMLKRTVFKRLLQVPPESCHRRRIPGRAENPPAPRRSPPFLQHPQTVRVSPLAI